MRSSLILLALLILPEVARAELTLEFDDTGAIVTGATPGGNVALVWVEREAKNGASHVTRGRTLLGADATGTARHPRDRPIARSVWAVIDVTTGDGLVASPGGAGVPRSADGSTIASDHALSGKFLSVDQADALDLTVVRPGVGAWNGRESLGGGEAPDGKVRVGIATLDSMADDGVRLKSLAPGDVVFGVDHRTLEFYLVELGTKREGVE